MTSDELRQELAALRAMVTAQADEIAALRRQATDHRAGGSSFEQGDANSTARDPARRSDALAEVSDARMSRRALARWGGAAAAGAVVSAAAVGIVPQSATAADGDSLRVGLQTNTSAGSDDPTVLYIVGGGTFSKGAFVVTDTAFSNFAESFIPGAVTGYANNVSSGEAGVAGYSGPSGTAGVFGASSGSTGVYGFTDGSGNAVFAEAAGTGSGVVANAGSGPAVHAESSTGVAVEAKTLGATQPAVRGTNVGSGITGYAGTVVGDSGVSGAGVLGLSNSGVGVSGVGVQGSTGVTGTSDSGPGVLGTDEGTGTGIGLTGTLTNPSNGSPALVGSTVGSGVGGMFAAPNAQIQLIPSTLSTHPTSGAVGELMVDATGRLWYCKATKKGDAKGVWVQLA